MSKREFSLVIAAVMFLVIISLYVLEAINVF
jgi:hypothetical protein